MAPANTKAQVEALLVNDPYSPEGIPTLEKYVAEQVKDKSYDVDANLGLLKLYQFHPQKLNKDVLSQVLCKALMALPLPDFSLCLFLIPEVVQTDAEVAKIIQLSNILETANFPLFWETLANVPKAKGTPGLEEAVRDFARECLVQTFQSVPKSVYKRVLNLDDKGVSADIKNHKEWEEAGDSIKLSDAVDSQMKPKKIVENIKFEQVSQLLSSFAKTQ